MISGLFSLLSGGFLALVFSGSDESASKEAFAKNHPVRRRLLEIILRRPGVRLATLWKELDANRKTAKYHLMVLERAAIVAAFEAERVTRYFPARIGPEERPLVALLLRGRVLEMIHQVIRNPGISQIELRKALTMSRKVLRDYANLLVEKQLVTEVREPHSCRYFATARLEQVLGHVSQPSQEDEKTESRGNVPGDAD